MTTPKCVKISSLIVLILLLAWVLIAVMSVIMQDVFLSFANAPYEVVSESEPVILLSTIIELVSAVALGISAFAMYVGKTRIIPLIISGCSALITPVLCYIANTMQTALSARLGGSILLVRLSTLTNMSSLIYYPLLIATIATVATAAVYAYSKAK